MNCVRFGQIGRLKKEKIEEYEALHANPWPAVIETIRDCNLKSYSIFRKEDQVFAYFEYLDLGQHAYSTKVLIEYLHFHLYV